MTNQSMCVIGIILFIVLIPKYLQLPKSLELLYQDKFGQLLLLILAVVVGSYNFTCGLLLTLLFLSIIIQTTCNIEGFEDSDIEDKVVTVDTGSIVSTVDKVAPSMEDESDMKLTEEFVDTTDETNTSSPSLDILSKELENTQKKLKMLETDINKYQKKETKKTAVENTEMDLEMNKKIEKAKKMTPRDTLTDASTNSSNTKTTKSPLKKEETMETIEAMEAMQEMEEIEGFGNCNSGDSTSSRNDEQRIKLLKYEEANRKDLSLVEPFVNLSKNTFNPYDSVGCKFDINFQPRNEFIYGPPVSSCDAYSNINLKQTGTVFYPLN